MLVDDSDEGMGDEAEGSAERLTLFYRWQNLNLTFGSSSFSLPLFPRPQGFLNTVYLDPNGLRISRGKKGALVVLVRRRSSCPV